MPEPPTAPQITFPDELPVSRNRDAIAAIAATVGGQPSSQITPVAANDPPGHRS